MKAVCGYEKNSDAIVAVDLSVSGIEVEIVSKLKAMFGKQMEKSVRDALAELEVSNAKVTVNDYGALDFVIKARTKTAVKRAKKSLEV